MTLQCCDAYTGCPTNSGRRCGENFRTLAKAQVALGTAILSYMPLRPQNLTALAFGTHLFVQEGTGISSRRAARHHYRLVQEALESQMPVRRRKKRAS
jgi:hypothetical protein